MNKYNILEIENLENNYEGLKILHVMKIESYKFLVFSCKN